MEFCEKQGRNKESLKMSRGLQITGVAVMMGKVAAHNEQQGDSRNICLDVGWGTGMEENRTQRCAMNHTHAAH